MVEFRRGRKRWEPICFHLPQQLHHGYHVLHRLQQINVLHLLCGQYNLRLQLDASDDWSAGVQDGIAGPGLCGAWVASSGRDMPVSTEVVVGIYLEALAAFGVQRDSLRPCDIEVLDKVDYCAPMRCPRILGEAGALMRHIDDVGPSAIL